MAKYRVEHDRPNCIGCGACAAVCDKFWAMSDEDGKSLLKGAKKEGSLEVLEIDEEDFECMKEAADSCPVNVIHIINKEKDEKVI